MGNTQERYLIMALFTSDLYRNFGIGFLLGGIAVALTNPGFGQIVTGLFA